MRAFALLTLTGLLVGLGAACGGVRPTSPGLDAYGAIPEGAVPVVPERTPAERLAAALRQSDADPELLRFLGTVAATAERHDWHALAARLDSAEVEQAFTSLTESGLGPTRAIAVVLETALGLPADAPPEETGPATAFRTLDAIRTLTFEHVDDQDADARLIHVRGTLRTTSGETPLEVQVTVHALGPGRYALSIPQG